MKTREYLLLLLLLIGFTSCGQTPEQQKMIDDAMRMQDSIMNTPEMKEMMKKLEEQEKIYNEEKKKNKVTEENSKNKSENKTNSNEDWYWKNTLASKNNKFENWKGGAADIMMGYRMKPGQQKMKTLKIGTINSEGTIVFNLPNDVQTQSTLNRRLNILVYDIQEASSLNYTNGDTGYFANASLFIMRNDKKIGALTLGNSVRVTYNLINQSSLYSGDEGYLLYWVYAQNDCALQVNEDWKGEVRRDGTNTIEVETNVNYNLNFKAGWNLVKVEVIGKYPLKHERGLDVSWFKNHKHTIITNIPSDSKYYYRASAY